MAVDTSRASERLRAWNEGDDDALPRGYTHDSLDFQCDLRALLARAEAAEGKAGSLQRRLDVEAAANDEAVRAVASMKNQRDAATAERDRLAGAMKRAAIAAEVESAGHAIAIIEAALSPTKKDPTDGE